MVSDINIFKSHPNKLLLDHIDGVINNVKQLTSSKLAELIAVFHDLGKMNPYFQKKLLIEGKSTKYSNHAYLSAYVFFCVFAGSKNNQQVLKHFLGWSELTKNDIIGISVLIAKHHSNIPDFQPINYKGDGVSILDKTENDNLFSFLSQVEMPITEYVNHYFTVDDFLKFIDNNNYQSVYRNHLCFNENDNIKALNFYLDYQYAFSCLIQSDKADAAEFDNFIDQQKHDVSDFCNIYSSKLDFYLLSLQQNTELNKLRTKIRNEVVTNLQTNIQKGRIFELTAPTGSGKTLMLLSLASEIMKQTGAKRIIYGLPFLSITEQVETEVLSIFQGFEKYIQRIDSKSENTRFETLQDELDGNPQEKTIKELSLIEFQENTFSYPFVITTFVRFFETLLSNRNSELLKLPNFSNCIFLLDEIQSLPPRLYGFFVAYISKFCEKFNSYAIISTATQPNFSLPDNNNDTKDFFADYKNPIQLLPLSYFDHYLFNRYDITNNPEEINLEDLKHCILDGKKSILVILNTINDTQDLYNLLLNYLSKNELILLNTHFTPQHRKLKIYLAKRRLRESKRIIVISTQLIEAGVDIDFPILYRDFATIPSIVQSAGRCNRNGDIKEKGHVHLFHLQRNGIKRAELIYRGIDRDLLRFTNTAITSNIYMEKELLSVQKEFFNRIQKEFHFAKHWKSNNGDLNNPDFDFLKDIRQCMFDKLGKFNLIDNQVFGEEYQFFVVKNLNDDKFEILLRKQSELIELIKNKSQDNLVRIKKKEIEFHLKKMSNQIILVHLNKNQHKPLLACEKSYFNLYKIDSSFYSFAKGIDLKNNECIL